MDRNTGTAITMAAAEGRFAESGVADHVRELIARDEGEKALTFLADAVEGDRAGLFWLHLSAAAKALGLRQRSESYRRRYAAADLADAISSGRFADAATASRARRLLDEGAVEQAFDLLEASADADQDSGFWISMEMAARSYGLAERATRYLYATPVLRRRADRHPRSTRSSRPRRSAREWGG